jgi:hypothetical protein
VGFNMSWIFVNGIDENALYEALELTATGETPDPLDLGTSYVPLAGAVLKSGSCAVFAQYSLVMDVTVGTNPMRLARLPAKSRCITCVVLEHAMVSYASLWQDGGHAWQIRHDASQGEQHLETSGDLPSAFAGFRDVALDKQRATGKSGQRRVDYVFDVPLDTAATITGYRSDRAVEKGFFRSVRTLIPTNGNALTRLSQPPGWWQTVGSIRYE